jgi:3-deoxy-D-manno-octulosonic-acid transferase
LSHGVAVLHGPHIENIDHVADEANKQRVAFTVRNSEEIEEKVDALLKQKDYRRRLASKAKSFINDQQGGAEKMATIIFKFLAS